MIMSEKEQNLDDVAYDAQPALTVTNPASKPVQLLSSAVLKGSNIYAASTVLCQEVEFGVLAGRYSREAGSDFPHRFLERFYVVQKTIPNGRVSERFLNRLYSSEGVPFEELLLGAVQFVESALAFAMYEFRSVDAGRVLATASPERKLLIWQTHVASLSRRVAPVALVGLLELLPKSLYPFAAHDGADFHTVFEGLEKRALRRRISTTTSLIVLAAQRRGIPSETLGGPHLYLGQGAAQRMVYSSVPADTPLAATQLCRNKHKAIRRLAQLRLPVPEHIRVASLEAAQAAATRLGYPVVVKPLKGKQAGGVSVGIANAREMASAFERAHSKGSDVIIESIVPGQTYRLLVIGGRYVAALKILPPSVRGDGQRSLAALIEALNSEPVRNSILLYKVEIDDELTEFLARNGYELDDVPAAGEEVILRSTANLAVGGVHTDVTDVVHPDNQAMAVRAAEGMGLSVAGIDFVCTDISQSYKRVGGCIIEMNARPGLYMHQFPRYGRSRDVAAAMLELSIPADETGRIPTAWVIGDRQTSRVGRELAAMLRAAGRMTGLATKKQVYVDGRVESLDGTQRRNAVRTLLRDPRLEAFIGTLSPRRLVRRGLGLDGIDTAAVLSPTADSDTELYRQGLDVLVKATRGNLVVSISNTLALEKLKQLDPRRLILVAKRFSEPVVQAHLAAGGTAVAKTQEQGQSWIVIRRAVQSLVRIPAMLADANEVADTRLFAFALAFGLGVSARQLEALQ